MSSSLQLKSFFALIFVGDACLLQPDQRAVFEKPFGQLEHSDERGETDAGRRTGISQLQRTGKKKVRVAQKQKFPFHFEKET
jgi:hypothetical protein